jgi:hypothetical protein
MAQAAQRAGARLVVRVERKAAQAFNVTARIAGRDPGLQPLVVSTPRSGWWQCASERGGGLACWLETMRALAAANPARECLFVAFSGHETGFIGIDAYLASRPELMQRAHAWVHTFRLDTAPVPPTAKNACMSRTKARATSGGSSNSLRGIALRCCLRAQAETASRIAKHANSKSVRMCHVLAGSTFCVGVFSP